MGFWNGSVVLVTGAHGFTGSYLCRELLKEGARVKAFVKNGGALNNLEDIRNQLTLTYGDMTDSDSLLKALDRVEYIFHPAAIVPVMDARNSPQKAFMVNGIGSFNLAHLAMKSGVKKMLHISTCHIYGNQPASELPIKESTVPLPGDLYAASKYAAEIYLRPLVDEGFSIVFSRAFAKYGPGQGSQFFIPRVITQLLKNQIPRLGSPVPTRDYSYITDIVRGYITVLEKGKKGEVYHLSSQKETSMGDVYNLICRLMRVKIEPVWNNETRPQDILRLFGDSGRARKEFGWEPKISLEKGLGLTIDWWKKNIDKKS